MTVHAPSFLRALPPVYAAAALRLALPLLLLPVMAVRLGPDEFGHLGLVLVWAGLLSLVVEGGFLAAATRHAVVADAAGRVALARQVFSARCASSALVVLLSLGVAAWVLPASTLPQALGAAALLAGLACALGWPASWYLQATQQLHRWAWVELAVYALWMVAALAFAHSVQGYLLLNLAAAGALAVAGWAWLRRDLAAEGGTRLWSAGSVRPGLRLGWSMLPVSLAGAAYSFALPAVASSQLPRSEIGHYFLADRIARSALAAADPVFQLVYPRIVARWTQGARAAWAYAGRWALVGIGAGAAMYAAGLLAWPALAPLLADQDTTVRSGRLPEVLAVLGLLLPLLMGWKFLGYCMLAAGRYDRAYRACVVVGGVYGVVAALLALRAPDADAATLATVALSAEIVVIVAALAGMALTPRTTPALRAR